MKTKGLKKLTFDDALSRARKFCALQERCTWEVKTKLLEWCDDEVVRDEIINQLINERFLSEQRFAELFVRSKVSQKHWGRFKIGFELHKRFIPSHIIEEALNKVDENQYLENFLFLKLKKEKETIEEEDYMKEMKVKAYLTTKGYEDEYINKFYK